MSRIFIHDLTKQTLPEDEEKLRNFKWAKIDLSVKPARYYTPSGFGLVSYTDYAILEAKLQEAETLLKQLSKLLGVK